MSRNAGFMPAETHAMIQENNELRIRIRELEERIESALRALTVPKEDSPDSADYAIAILRHAFARPGPVDPK
jgi:hypothetical protein